MLLELISEFITFVFVIEENSDVILLALIFKIPPEPSDEVTSMVLVDAFFTFHWLLPVSLDVFNPLIVKTDEPERLLEALVSLTLTIPAPEPEDLLIIESLTVLKLILALLALNSPPMLPIVLALKLELMRILWPPPIKPPKLKALISEFTCE